MAVSPDGKGVLLFGGISTLSDHISNEILELRAWANWTILNVTLQEQRSSHTAIPIQ